jgi:hypothetical protein
MEKFQNAFMLIMFYNVNSIVLFTKKSYDANAT